LNSVYLFVGGVYCSLSATRDWAWYAPSLFYYAQSISFLGTNLPVCGTGHSHSFSTEVKEIVVICYLFQRVWL